MAAGLNNVRRGLYKLLRLVQTSNMAAKQNPEFVIAANKKGQAPVWKYFSFIEEKEDSVIDNTRVGLMFMVLVVIENKNHRQQLCLFNILFGFATNCLNYSALCSSAHESCAVLQQLFVKHFIAFGFSIN